MNIETGEIKQFADDTELADFMKRLSGDEKEKWVKVETPLTTKQIKKMQIDTHDHRSPTAIERDLLRKKRRVEKLKAIRDARKEDTP